MSQQCPDEVISHAWVTSALLVDVQNSCLRVGLHTAGLAWLLELWSKVVHWRHKHRHGKLNLMVSVDL